MRRAQQGTIYDGLRIPVGRDGAIKSPSPQSERAPIESSWEAGMDSSGVGQAATTDRHSRTYTGGELTPQRFTRTPANVDDSLTSAGVAMNARASLPNRGLTPNSPLARRR